MVESNALGRDSPPDDGGMAEWTKAAVLKTAVGFTAHRGFESLSLRQYLSGWNGLLNLNMGEVPEWLIGAAC